MNKLQRYPGFIAAKRGLAAAVHSGDPACDALPTDFERRPRPAFRTLLAAAAGPVRADVEPNEPLGAVASLCAQARKDRPGQAERLVALLVDHLRHGAKPPATDASERNSGRSALGRISDWPLVQFRRELARRPSAGL